MAPNCPAWYLSSWATTFSGGLSAGIYYTNAPDVVSYITDHASTDILVLENLKLLLKIMDNKENLATAFPSVKVVILIESNKEELNEGNSSKPNYWRFQILPINSIWKILYELPFNLSKTTWQCHQLGRYDANRRRAAR